MYFTLSLVGEVGKTIIQFLYVRVENDEAVCDKVQEVIIDKLVYLEWLCTS